MPTRSPVVANQFYPGSREALESMLDELFRPFAGKRPASAPFIFMLPHAGYIFSGFTAAATLEGVRLPVRTPLRRVARREVADAARFRGRGRGYGRPSH